MSVRRLGGQGLATLLGATLLPAIASAWVGPDEGGAATTGGGVGAPAETAGGDVAVPATGGLTAPKEGTGHLGGEAGLGLIEGVPYLTLGLGATARLGNIGFGVLVPLRFRVLEGGTPTFDLRDEDWDTTSDYFRVLRFLEFGTPQDPLYGRVGELTATTVGHGTAMNLYYNTLDLDTYQPGIRANANLLSGGIETVVDNLADPSLGGARMYVRPLAIVDPQSEPTRWAAGFTVLGDAFADEAARGAGIPGGVLLLGLDTDYRLVETATLGVTPYTDLNWIWGCGVGWHLGTLANLRFPLEVAASARLEWRWMSEEYLPGYFGTLYEVERLGLAGGERKSRLLRRSRGGHGMYGEVAVGLAGMATVAGIYEDAEGPGNGSLTLRMELTRVGPVRLGAYYSRHRLEGLGDAFGMDDRSFLVAEGRIQVNPLVHMVVQAAHRWTEREDGRLEGAWEWNVGAGISIAF